MANANERRFGDSQECPLAAWAVSKSDTPHLAERSPPHWWIDEVHQLHGLDGLHGYMGYNEVRLIEDEHEKDEDDL